MSPVQSRTACPKPIRASVPSLRASFPALSPKPIRIEKQRDEAFYETIARALGAVKGIPRVEEMGSIHRKHAKESESTSRVHREDAWCRHD
jgi:hypothetical protein